MFPYRSCASLILCSGLKYQGATEQGCGCCCQRKHVEMNYLEEKLEVASIGSQLEQGS